MTEVRQTKAVQPTKKILVCPHCGMGACSPLPESRLIAVTGVSPDWFSLPHDPGNCLHSIALVTVLEDGSLAGSSFCGLPNDHSDEDAIFCFCNDCSQDLENVTPLWAIS